MTQTQKQILRENLLRQLEVVRTGLPFDSLRIGVNAGGFGNIPNIEVEDALGWLTRKGFVEESRADWSDVVRIWRITEEGIDFLDR